MHKTRLIAPVGAALLLASPALAQSDPDLADVDNQEAQTITVLASGAPQALEATGQQITVFDKEQIEAVQGADITRLLERAPGVSLSRNGGVGSFTALRVRGAEAEQVLVLVDGVRLADPASPGAGFDLGTLAMGNLSRVELQRSSNSTIWGSQAIGGVLLVETDMLRGAQSSLEFGSHETLYATGNIGGEIGPLHLAANGGYLDSNGFSAAEAGGEADGYRQWELAGRANVQVARGLSGFANMRLAEAQVDIDGFPAPAFTLADTDEYQDTRQLSGALGLAYDAGDIALRASYSQARTKRENYNPAFGAAPGYTTNGLSQNAQLRGQANVLNSVSLQFGAEQEWTAFSTLFDPRQQTWQLGSYLQADYTDQTVSVAAGLRRDEHRDFGSEWSFGADASYALSQNIRLTASYGEGFKAPSLFQLLSDFGNAGLQPETSRSFDIGIAAETGPFAASVSAFRRNTRDQIAFVSCFGMSGGICTNRPFGTYDNVTRTRAEGIEAQVSARLGSGLTLQGVYALVDTKDRDSGNVLARRPRHAATITALWQPHVALNLAADLRVVSHSFDDAGNFVRLDGYEVMSLRGDWSVTPHLRLFGRMENLWAEDYQTAAGYATGGRSAHVGVRLQY